MSALPNPVDAPAHILSLLNRLHAKSSAEEAAVSEHLSNTVYVHDLFRDKFNALDQDKAHCLYMLCRAIRARNVVEVGTSFGVSTIYLALAVGSNAASLGQPGKVIATEIESKKATRAREHWHEAGEQVESLIELREGDFFKTLANNLPQIDLLYIDTWAPLVVPALRLLEPTLRSGTTIVINTGFSFAAGCPELYEYLRAAEHGYMSVSIPYTNKLIMMVKV